MAEKCKPHNRLVVRGLFARGEDRRNARGKEPGKIEGMFLKGAGGARV